MQTETLYPTITAILPLTRLQNKYRAELTTWLPGSCDKHPCTLMLMYLPFAAVAVPILSRDVFFFLSLLGQNSKQNPWWQTVKAASEHTSNHRQLPAQPFVIQTPERSMTHNPQWHLEKGAKSLQISRAWDLTGHGDVGSALAILVLHYGGSTLRTVK